MKSPDLPPRHQDGGRSGSVSAIMVAGNARVRKLMPGCWDPSVVGYWEHTPTKVPVLNRISAIEGPEDQFVEIDRHHPRRPHARHRGLPRHHRRPHRCSPSGTSRIVNQPSLFQPIVDSRGFIEIPDLGQIFVHGTHQR